MTSIALNALSIVYLFTGVFIWIICLIVRRNQPKKINRIYGYRTKRSMRSQDEWDFAQEFSIAKMLKIAQITVILGVLSIALPYSRTIFFIGIALFVLLMFYPVYKTEMALREKFG